MMIIITDVHSTAEGERGLISKHVHYQLVHGNCYNFFATLFCNFQVPGNSVPGHKIIIIIISERRVFLFQRCSVLVLRFNAILLHDSLPTYDCTD